MANGAHGMSSNVLILCAYHCYLTYCCGL